MAKLSLFTRDQSAMDNGIRVEVGPAGQKFGITTRGLTDAYYDRMFALKRQAAAEINAALKPGDLPVSPDNLPPSYEDKNMATALVECCLIGVDALEDDDGNAVTFDAFCAMLPERANQGLLSLAYSAARSVGLVQQAQKDDAAKN
ncbi:hypothetical protein [Acetobacter malorum]|uniref:Uncharacterized protein n=1 Tax=Acetobacter malorum TaxID=178901 RepID=A0A1Y3G8D8_9PROT|nr:hypothetical protein [Acetobacter malorum]OUJ05361.1 hypothetical protein HK23_06200 [Acetobacter malorum]